MADMYAEIMLQGNCMECNNKAVAILIFNFCFK